MAGDASSQPQYSAAAQSVWRLHPVRAQEKGLLRVMSGFFYNDFLCVCVCERQAEIRGGYDCAVKT